MLRYALVILLPLTSVLAHPARRDVDEDVPKPTTIPLPVPCPAKPCDPCPPPSVPTWTTPPGECMICGCGPPTTKPPSPTTTTSRVLCPQTICGPCSPGSTPTSTVPPGQCPICSCAPTPTKPIITSPPTPPIVCSPLPCTPCGTGSSPSYSYTSTAICPTCICVPTKPPVTPTTTPPIACLPAPCKPCGTGSTSTLTQAPTAICPTCTCVPAKPTVTVPRPSITLHRRDGDEDCGGVHPCATVLCPPLTNPEATILPGDKCPSCKCVPIRPSITKLPPPEITQPIKEPCLDDPCIATTCPVGSIGTIVLPAEGERCSTCQCIFPTPITPRPPKPTKECPIRPCGCPVGQEPITTPDPDGCLGCGCQSVTRPIPTLTGIPTITRPRPTATHPITTSPIIPPGCPKDPCSNWVCIPWDSPTVTHVPGDKCPRCVCVRDPNFPRPTAVPITTAPTLTTAPTSTLSCSASCKIGCPTGHTLTGSTCPFCECWPIGKPAPTKN